ncbi:ABC transporter permease [Nocardioides sp. WS12]|uniref:ABC transporter permease n=1 Tax=Nocardioides sp. WS12 TaxID=2486272 RepID=UPI0015FB3DF7|nr:ABC transporter permease [Nocardioides sp. WS12]
MSRLPNIGLDRFSGLYLWAAFIILFGIWSPELFLTSATAHSIGSAYAVPALLALALLVPMATGCFDVSVGATANLATIVVIVLQVRHEWGMWTAIAATLLVGAAVGFMNGLIVVGLKVDSFIATLASATVIGAVTAIVMGPAVPMPVVDETWRNLTAREGVLGFPVIVFWVLAVGLVLYWVLDHAKIGRYLYAIGGNREASRLAGVAVDRWQWMSFIISGVISAFAGVVFASYSGPSSGYGMALLLPAFAAAFLGTTQVRPGRPNVWGTLIAVYVLATGVKGMQLVTGEPWLNDMFNGVALILAVAFAGWRQRNAKRSPRARSGVHPDNAEDLKTSSSQDITQPANAE